MTATDHEAAIRDVLPPCSCPEPHFVNRCFSCIALDHLDALVGLLQQAEQRAEDAQREADHQLIEKLAAQLTLKAITDSLCLPRAALSNAARLQGAEARVRVLEEALREATKALEWVYDWNDELGSNEECFRVTTRGLRVARAALSPAPPEPWATPAGQQTFGTGTATHQPGVAAPEERA